MERMNQGDAFKCINEVLGIKYRVMADVLSRLTGTETDYTSLNKTANQKRAGSDIFKHTASEIFAEFFVGRVDQKETLADLTGGEENTVVANVHRHGRAEVFCS